MEVFDSQADARVDAILSMRNKDELKRFLTDLCTIPEIKSMAQRYDVACLLDKGMTYDHIFEKTGASKATISRVNRCLVWGAGGYKLAIGNGENIKQEEVK